MILLFDNTYSKRKAEIASPTMGKLSLQKLQQWHLQLAKKKNQSLKILTEIRLRILEFVHLSNARLSSILFHFYQVF